MALAHGLGTEKCFDVSGLRGQGIHFSAALRAKDGSQIHPWLCGGGLVILWLSTKTHQRIAAQADSVPGSKMDKHAYKLYQIVISKYELVCHSMSFHTDM